MLSNATSLARLLTEPDLPLIAQIENATYHTLHLVVRRDDAGATSAYCLERDWEATPAAQLAQCHRRIAELEAELKQLRTGSDMADMVLCPHPGCTVRMRPGHALTMHQVRAHGSVVHTVTEQRICTSCGKELPIESFSPRQTHCKPCSARATRARQQRARQERATIPCPECGASFLSMSGMKSHRTRVHQAPTAAEESPPDPRQPVASNGHTQPATNNGHQKTQEGTEESWTTATISPN